MVTLEDVARLAGVSRSTVSRVINHHPNVRPETRERVWEAIKACGYHPHVMARSLVTNRTRILGVLIPEAVTKVFTDPFFPLLLRGATEACNRHGYQLVLSLFHDPHMRDENYRRTFRSGYLDGAIVASAPLGDPLVASLLEDKVTFVSIGRSDDPRVPYVDVDNAGGAFQAVDHLIRLGHRRIATITGPLDLPAAKDRLEGYRRALLAHGLEVREEWIFEGDFTEASGLAGVRSLLPQRPTAIFAASDAMAIGALKGLRQAGLGVPEDVAVVGFDDVPLAVVMEPALTTVRQPIEELGRKAVEMLLSLLGEGDSPLTAPRRIILPTTLVVRASSGGERQPL